MKSDSNSQHIEKRKQPSRGSIVTFFVVGSLMIAGPLALMLNWPSVGCSSQLTQGACRGPQLYKTSITILPYVMLAGGAIVVYNMKRVSDSISAEGDDPEGLENGEEEQDDLL
jgi:hypothetical protein